MANKKVLIRVYETVEYCSLCPFGRVLGPVWDGDTEVYQVRCEYSQRIVHDDLSWNEVAKKCSNPTNCGDTVPDDCPADCSKEDE